MAGKDDKAKAGCFSLTSKLLVHDSVCLLAGGKKQSLSIFVKKKILQ
jgi:hypothetical protein